MRLKDSVTDEMLHELGFVHHNNHYPLYKENPTPFYPDEAIIITENREVRIICSMNTPNKYNCAFLKDLIEEKENE